MKIYFLVIYGDQSMYFMLYLNYCLGVSPPSTPALASIESWVMVPKTDIALPPLNVQRQPLSKESPEPLISRRSLKSLAHLRNQNRGERTAQSLERQWAGAVRRRERRVFPCLRRLRFGYG